MAQNNDYHKLRLQLGLSQEEVSGYLKMSRPTWVKVERGERELTKDEQDQLDHLAEVSFPHAKEDIRIDIPQLNAEKFKQVFLYILEKTAGKPNIGMTALYKLLYFIDFDYYEKYEKQLMGLTYIKNTHGPTPRDFIKVIDQMKKAEQIEEVDSKYFTFDQKKFLPRQRADLGLLSAQELEMINSVLVRYSDKNASELSHLSHEDTPWDVAEEGKNIEYEHVFYRPEKFSVREYEEL
jgi:transcriptional regulator with XRE-family HTH domain